jgi:hypothetical protein
MVTEARTAELSLIETTPSPARSGALATLKLRAKNREKSSYPPPPPKNAAFSTPSYS